MGPFTLPRSQKDGGLLKLPSELRLIVYEELFPPTRIEIHSISGGLYIDQRDDEGIEGTTSILRCCQTLYEEARPVLHGSFDVHLLFRFAGRMAMPWFFYEDEVQSQQIKSLPPFSALSLHINLVDEDDRSIHEENDHLFPEHLRRAVHGLRTLVTEINATPSITKLHIQLEVYQAGDPPGEAFLDEVACDNTMRSLQNIECYGTITATMTTSIGEYHFNTTSYYDMLAKLSGVDLTRQCYEKAIGLACGDRNHYVAELEALSSEHTTDTRNETNCSEETMQHREDAVWSAGLDRANLKDPLVIRQLLERAEDEVASLKMDLESQVGDRWPRVGP